MNVKKIGFVGIVCAVGLFNTVFAQSKTTTVPVTAKVVGTCKFTTTAGSVSFLLDPSINAPASGTVVNPTFYCTKNATYTLTADNGQNFLISRRMVDPANPAVFIPYTFAFTATGSGNGFSGLPLAMNITSSVLYADFQNAPVSAAYADSVVVSISP